MYTIPSLHWDFSRSWIWVSIPTSSSSTLWLMPGDVSIYLQPYLMAKDFPARKKREKKNQFFSSYIESYYLVSIIFKKNCWSFGPVYFFYIYLTGLISEVWNKSHPLNFHQNKAEHVVQSYTAGKGYTIYISIKLPTNAKIRQSQAMLTSSNANLKQC